VFATLTAQQAEWRNRLAALRSELAALGTEPDIRVRPPLATLPRRLSLVLIFLPKG